MARIHRYARTGRFERVVDCIAEGDDVNATDVHGFTPIMLASREGFARIVRALFAAGADPNIAHPNGRTPLHLAASSGRLAVVKLLVTHGANANAVSKIGETPMLEAAEFNHRETVGFLKQIGADSDVRGRDGMTADEWLACGGVIGRGQDEIKEKFREWSHRLVSEKIEDRFKQDMSQFSTPEEYCAKHGRNILVFGYANNQFRDPGVQLWVRRVHEILKSSQLLAECEERFLTGEELESARRHRRRLQRTIKRYEERKLAEDRERMAG